MNTIPPHITAWAAYKDAERRGDLKGAERHHRQWLDLLSGSTRTDAASTDMKTPQDQKPAAAKGEIDWANVASEVNTMLELNQPAQEAMKAGKEQKPKGD